MSENLCISVNLRHAYNDQLKGGSGNDILLGAAADLLLGGNGRDLLVGGFDSDWLGAMPTKTF